MFNIHFSIERWKWSDDFGIYVSNKGHFRTRDKKELPIKIGKGGYCYVYCSGNVNGYRLAHRVVMLTWRPLKDGENLTVDHLDHNKRNNALDNLEWVTMEENLRRANQDFLSSNSEEVVVKEVIKEVEKFAGLPESKYDVLIKFVESGVVMTIEQTAKFFFKANHRIFPNATKTGCCLTLKEMEEAIFCYKKMKLFGNQFEKIAK